MEMADVLMITVGQKTTKQTNKTSSKYLDEKKEDVLLNFHPIPPPALRSQL